MRRIVLIVVAVFALIFNVFCVYSIYSNNTTISSYDAGYKSGNTVGQMDSYWKKYTGTKSNRSITTEDKRKAEGSNDTLFTVIIVGDLVLAAVAAFVVRKVPA